MGTQMDPYKIQDIETIVSPSLVIFEEIMRANIERMIDIAGDPARLRPHCKTHKMAAVIDIMLERGITKHKCATLAEAEMLAQAGVKDIFLGYSMVGPNLKRLVQLLKIYPDVQMSVTCDDEANVEQLATTMQDSDCSIGVMVDVNPGMNRTGIDIEYGAATLIRKIVTEDRLSYCGLHIYDGHHRQREVHIRQQAVDELFQRVCKLCDELKEEGIETPKLVAGGTGSFPCFANIDDPRLELSPGTVVFYDAGYREAFPDLPFEPAALILTRVISKPAPKMLTLDLGHKACAADPPAGNRLAFPALPDKVERQHNEEHLVVETELADQYRVGDELLAIPWHACPTSAVHEYAFVIRDGKLAGTWDVTARNRKLTV